MFKKPNMSLTGSTSSIKLPLISKSKPQRRSTFVQTKLPKLKTKPLIESFKLEEIERKFKIRNNINAADYDDDEDETDTLPLVFRWDKISTGSTSSLLRSDSESSRFSLSSNSSTESLNKKSTKSKERLKSADKSGIPKSPSTPRLPSAKSNKDKKENKYESVKEPEIWDLIEESSVDAESIPERIEEQMNNEEEEYSEWIQSEKRENPTALSPILSNFVLQRSYSKTDFLFYYYY